MLPHTQLYPPFYFAYGSNMDSEQMKARCPEAVPVSTGILHDHTLGFSRWSIARQSGAIDVIPKSGSDVYGVIYKIKEPDLVKLDFFEGTGADVTPPRYQRTLVKIEPDSKGQLKGLPNPLKVYLYEVNEKKHSFTPTKEYMDMIIKAAQKAKLPETYLAILQDIPTAAPSIRIFVQKLFLLKR